MVTKVDLSGTRFGRLVPVRFHDTVRQKSRWWCRCDCGAELPVVAGDLRSGNTKSCGCIRPDPKQPLTREYLRSILDYDQDTGEFRWKKVTKYHPRMDRKSAGGRGTGYIKIKIHGQKYSAHRLAWLYIRGEWPPSDLDHRNGETFDNPMVNLRPATNAQNQANKRRNTGKLLPKGVRPMGRGFEARIGFENKSITIGTFPAVEQAAQAYFTKAQELYGDFARSA